MANEQNLRPSEYKLSQEEQKKGGIASGKARREKKQIKEWLQILGNEEIANKKGEIATRNEIVAFNVMKKAMSGDLKAVDIITKLTGEQVTKAEITGADGKPLIPEDSRTQAEKEAEIARLLKKGE